jgi:membrane protein required for colicin V production
MCMISYYFRFMNMLDLFICVFFGVGAYYGWKQGLVMSVFQLVAVVLGFYVAFHFSNQIALLFVSSNDGIVVPLIAFILVLIGVYFLVKISGRLFERSIRFAWPSMLNNVFGAIIGALKWGFFAGTLFLIISPLNSSNRLISKKSKDESLLYNFTIGYTQTFMPGVKNTLVLGYDAIVK